MKILSATDAVKNHQQNKFNKWNSTKIIPELASERLRNDVFEPFISPGFKFKQKDNVFTIGSCFARGLESALSSEKINIFKPHERVRSISFGRTGDYKKRIYE